MEIYRNISLINCKEIISKIPVKHEINAQGITITFIPNLSKRNPVKGQTAVPMKLDIIKQTFIIPS